QARPHVDPLSLHDALPISKRGQSLAREAHRGESCAGEYKVHHPILRTGRGHLSIPTAPDLRGTLQVINSGDQADRFAVVDSQGQDRKSTRLNSSHVKISYA